jgi:hypothetical protein
MGKQPRRRLRPDPRWAVLLKLKLLQSRPVRRTAFSAGVVSEVTESHSSRILFDILENAESSNRTLTCGSPAVLRQQSLTKSSAPLPNTAVHSVTASGIWICHYAPTGSHSETRWESCRSRLQDFSQVTAGGILNQALPSRPPVTTSCDGMSLISMRCLSFCVRASNSQLYRGLDIEQDRLLEAK